MNTEDRDSQRNAIFLIVFAAFCIASGCYFGWRDLVNFATAFGGAGAGILTGGKFSRLTNRDGGQITITPTEQQ